MSASDRRQALRDEKGGMTVALSFELSPCGEDFLKTAGFVRVFSADLSAPVDRVWAELTGDGALEWSSLVRRVTYAGDRPRGVGLTRDISLNPPLVRMRERYFLWEEEPGERYRNTFYVVRSSLPGIATFAEDCVVERLDDARCRFVWTFAIEPIASSSAPMRLLAPVLERAFGKLMRDTEAHFNARSPR